jgi:hypothetical protein
MLAGVASNGASRGFDYRDFWRRFGHSTEKLNLIALAASDRDNPISADWLEGWLRREIERRRAAGEQADTTASECAPIVRP